ncbi:MAG: DDE-type integrase/transposase/recombinase [Deltaproteobacteria bacterium]
MKQEVVALKKENPNLNCQWVSELVSDRFEQPISQPSVWRILKSENLLTKEIGASIVRARFEAEACGDLVQMDTTWGYWVNGQRINLILLLDDHSRYIMAAEFFWEDSAYNNMQMIRDVVQDYGRFKVLYTDNASFFKAIRYNQSRFYSFKQPEYESEITRACRQIGITHITHKPYQPQGKGKIERIFRFIQERVISQFEKEKVCDLESANGLLWEWIDWYHEKHVNRTTGMTPKKRFNPNGFIPLSGEVNLDDVFCFKDTRKVDSCNSFSFEGTTYIIPKEYCMVAFKVDLHIHPFRSIRVFHNGKFICELPIKVD